MIFGLRPCRGFRRDAMMKVDEERGDTEHVTLSESEGSACPERGVRGEGDPSLRSG
jgi:hypothetical protein